MNKIFESAYIYALLIFLGFYNYHCFYNNFDINIATFLTSGELLLSFLPLTIPIVVMGAVLTIFYIRTIVEISIESKKSNNSNYTKRIPDLFVIGSAYRNLKSELNEINWKSFKNIFSIFLSILGIIIGFGFILFFIGYIFYFLLCIENKYVNPNINQLIFYGLFWFILFDDLLEMVYNGNSKAINISRFFLLIIFSVGLINISNSVHSKNILNGNGKVQIEFEYNNLIVNSDSNFVYVGKTEKYLFMRDLKKKQNCIYPTDKIGMIEINSNK